LIFTFWVFPYRNSKTDVLNRIFSLGVSPLLDPWVIFPVFMNLLRTLCVWRWPQTLYFWTSYSR